MAGYILDFAKAEAGKLTLEAMPYNLREVASEVTELLHPNADERGIGLYLHIAERVPASVIGDPDRLRQVLINLLGNAIKFTLRGHVRLAIDVRHLDERQVQLFFSVRDTGIGIAPEALDGLFEEFSQGDVSTTTREYGGTGLGLAICRQLVDLMGGELSARSEFGQGSDFTFTLTLQRPLLATPPSAIATDSGERPTADATVLSPPESQRLQHSRVLVVDDNAINQKLMRKLIERRAVRVDVVGNGQEAVEMLRQLPYDMVFMDCQMPVMDGYQATAMIRQQLERHAQTPIIAMTANAMAGDREKCLAAGMTDYVAKPIRSARIDELLQRWGNPLHSNEPM